jgi:hypothetical protein
MASIHSFLELKCLAAAVLHYIELEITIKPSTPNGLIFYNG